MFLVCCITHKVFPNPAFWSETAFIPYCVQLLPLNICLSQSDCNETWLCGGLRVQNMQHMLLGLKKKKIKT